MYLSFYDLNTEPFKISTDPAFLWLGEKHKEALATLRYGILGNKGILLLTGDVGTGKTTLINMLLKNLGEDTIVATVPDPGLDRMDFYNYVASAFDINKTFYTKGEFILYLTHFLKTAYADNKKVLLIIDEAQRLNKDLLEEIRLLSNIELQHTKLINLFFVGQIEFNDIISSEENKALRQRITLRYNIDPLNLDETTEYVKHRLQVAGAKRTIFNTNAISELYSFSQGYPRLINVICDFALLTGFVKEQKVIDAAIIRECASELKIPQKIKKQIVPEEKKIEDIVKEEVAKQEIIWRPYALGIEKKEQAVIHHLPQENKKKPIFYKLGIIILILLLLISLAYQFLTSSNKNIAANLWTKIQNSLHGDEITATKPIHSQSSNGSVSIVQKKDAVNLEPTISSAHKANKIPEETISQKKPQSMLDKNPPQNITSNAEPTIAELTNKDSSISETDMLVPASVSPPIDSTKISSSDDQPYPVQPMGIYGDQEAISAIESADSAQTQKVNSTKNVIDKILIFFDSNSFSLNDEAILKLTAIIKILERYPKADIIIKGYTDNTGPFVYNERLSIFRAFSVKSFLVDNGVDPAKAKAFGMGPRPPVDEQGNKIPYKLTRTVEIEIVE